MVTSSTDPPSRKPCRKQHFPIWRMKLVRGDVGMFGGVGGFFGMFKIFGVLGVLLGVFRGFWGVEGFFVVFGDFWNVWFCSGMDDRCGL